jgi:hypothetical protein
MLISLFLWQPKLMTMSPEDIFRIVSSIAVVGWLILLVLPFWHAADKFIIGIIVTLLALVYAWLIFSSFHFSDFKKFNSLEGVRELFENKVLLTAGWVHYLAFDLMTGLFIRSNAIKYGISHWLVAPCLLLTFMLGPVGLLLFLFIRLLKNKRYFADNY